MMDLETFIAQIVFQAALNVPETDAWFLDLEEKIQDLAKLVG